MSRDTCATGYAEPLGATVAGRPVDGIGITYVRNRSSKATHLLSGEGTIWTALSDWTWTISSPPSSVTLRSTV